MHESPRNWLFWRVSTSSSCFARRQIVFTVQDDFERVENERDCEVFRIMKQVIVISNNA